MKQAQITPKAAHRNIFRMASYDTVALPVGIFDALLAKPETKPTTVLLYVYLLRCASRGPVTRIHTTTILTDTGLSRVTFIKARADLEAEKLIKFVDIQTKGVCEYEMLGEGGCTLPTSDTFVVFKDQPDTSIEAFYTDRIGSAGTLTTDGYLLFTCPFHKIEKKEKQPPFRVTLNQGHEHHGRYYCTRCDSNGGLISFESEIAKVRRQATPANPGMAVRNFLSVQLMVDSEAESETLEGRFPELFDHGNVTI